MIDPLATILFSRAHRRAAATHEHCAEHDARNPAHLHTNAAMAMLSLPHGAVEYIFAGAVMRQKPLFVAVAIIAGLQQADVRATDWLQFGYDTAHSGFNRAETGYSTAGNKILYHYALPAGSDKADSAPVYLGNVATGSGTKNVLFILTNNGTFMALDADSTTLNVLWSHQPAGGGATTRGFGSGAIDPDLQSVYAYGFDGKIHKYAVADGSEVTTGGWPEVSTLKPEVEKGAAGLSIATSHTGATYLYSVTDGYIGDQNDYQGHVTAIDLASGAQKVFNSLCSDKTIHFCNSASPDCAKATNDCSSRQNGIWGRPGAIYDDGTDRLFITTGNGPFNANTGGLNWGDSVLALNPDGSGSGGGMPLDSYTPATFQSLQNTDADLGSESIAIVPPPPGTAIKYRHIAAQAGKDGCVRLINLADLSGQGAPAKTGGELDAKNLPGGSHCATGSDGPEIKPQPAVWVNPADSSSWIYVTSYGDGSAAYKISLDGSGKPSLSLQSQWPVSPDTFASGTSPVVANATLYYMSGNHLVARDAATGAVLSKGSAWASTSFSSQHWESPIIVNGRLYLFNDASPSELWVFQLDGAFRSGFD
jgi:hypothetical protein